MSPEKQRILMAEACGWKQQSAAPGLNPQWRDAKGSFYDLPDYLSDLNAMHEAEKVLDEGGRLRFGEQLHAILKLGYELDDDTQLSGWSVFETTHATAAQRAEAFLRAIGKWEDT